jgi:hypothetical protein
MHSFIKVLEELLVFFLTESEGQGVSDCNFTEGGVIIGNRHDISHASPISRG